MVAIQTQFEEYELLAYNFSSTNDCVFAFSSQPFSASASKMICAGCNTEIRRGEHILGFNGIVFHVKCSARRQLIKDYELYMSESPPYYTNRPTNMGHPKCYICNNFIPCIDGYVQYKEHPFWALKYCPSHANDGTYKCISCGRLKPKGIKYILLKDGRRLCPECASFKIMDTNECQPLFHEIQEFFASLDMKLDQKIPLGLVKSQALENTVEGEENGRHHSFTTLGHSYLESTTIPIVRMMEKIGGFPFMDMLKQHPELVCNREVTAIHIQYGLPRLLTGSILAHEMTHAWLHLQGYPHLNPIVEEGICHVLAHMWLISKINVGSETAMAAACSSSSLQRRRSNKPKQLSEIEKKLGECFIHQIENDASLVYGGGFWMGNLAVSQHGLKKTLDCIKLTRTFPPFKRLCRRKNTQ